jgi:thymidylate kinase
MYPAPPVIRTFRRPPECGGRSHGWCAGRTSVLIYVRNIGGSGATPGTGFIFESKRRMRSVALIGPDGAGKSTVAREVARRVAPARYLYMGVNLEESTLTLPTTRLALAIKRARGRGPRMTADWSAVQPDLHGRKRLVKEVYAGIRLLGWLAEEWYRALVARIYGWQGNLVVFDRHFLFDYYASHVERQPGQLLAARLHGMLLRRFYPRPDMVVVLDAPAEILHARKREQSVETLERRRQEYLALSAVARDFNVVDATRPQEDVAREITALVRSRTAPIPAPAA